MAESGRISVEEWQRMMDLRLQMRRIPQEPPLITDTAERLEDVNCYFRIKAGVVIESHGAVGLLAEVNRRGSIRGDALAEVGLSQKACELAMLSAAGFCDVGQDGHVNITDDGLRFLEWLWSV